MDIQKLINTNKIDRYTIEIEYTDDENKEHLKKIIEKLNKPLQNKLNNFNNKMDEYEKLTMKKQFYRLKLEQKKNLIKDYFKTKNIEDDKLENFADNIIELIGNNTLKNKDIEYDMNDIKIKNINKIDIVDNELKFIKQVKQTKQVKKKILEKNDSESE
jgi:hypothetical protein